MLENDNVDNTGQSGGAPQPSSDGEAPRKVSQRQIDIPLASMSSILAGTSGDFVGTRLVLASMSLFRSVFPSFWLVHPLAWQGYIFYLSRTMAEGCEKGLVNSCQY